MATATAAQVEQLARLLAACDPESTPYDSPTGAEVDGNTGYWNDFAERLLAKRAERFDREGVWEALVELTAVYDDRPLADNSDGYERAIDQIGKCFI